MLVFSTCIGALVELAAAGLTLEQCFRVRLPVAPVLLLAGRPCGVYRKWCFARFLPYFTDGYIGKAIVDTFANGSFQVTLFVIILALNGATTGQMIEAVSSVMLINLVAVRPYGAFLKFCGKLVRADGP